ncbi:MAG: heparinase II/III family protein [Planctomycetes bacterium]|nr:heparinase II/III family protein [Planctomycetota bacterium]
MFRVKDSLRSTGVAGMLIAALIVGRLLGADDPAATPAPSPSPAAAPDLAAAVRTERPRLFLRGADLPRLRALVKDDPTAAAWYAEVRASARALLPAPLVEYRRDKRGNWLGAARSAVDRIWRLAFVALLDGDHVAARRAIAELLHAAELPTWDPDHFLDVAELTHAVGLGYDWLHAEMTPDERATVRDAICRLGLRAGLSFYRTRAPLTRHGFNWALADHNWNLVCNGGMVAGAIAVADEEPALAAEVLRAAPLSARQAFASFAPDGGWGEGPGYWAYATEYGVLLLAALEGALDPARAAELTGPLRAAAGFSRTGDFAVHALGPRDLAYNFADANEPASNVAPQMYWLARAFHRPLYAWHAARHRTGTGRDLLWYSPEQQGPRAAAFPLDAYFRGVEAVFLRGAWEDPAAVYVGFKGGDNSENHSHLDLGTFVLDGDGVRWAVDLGRDDYALPHYFSGAKSKYYRLRTAGHNTLLLDGKNQFGRAKAPVVAYRSTLDAAYAVADLSGTYPESGARARRGVLLRERREVLVQDELELARPAEAAWQMHTRAEVSLDGARAELRQDGKTWTATLLSPAGAVFTVESAAAPAPENPNTGVRKLVVRLALPAGPARIAVRLASAERASATAPPELRPLDDWVRDAR